MMSERFKVTKFEEPSGKTYKNYGATSAETDAEAKGKLLPDSALPADSQRVVGGTPATIRQYPYSAALLRSNDFIHYLQKCGGTIVQRRFVMTAANCVIGDTPIRWRIRVGSVFANSGGVVHHTNEIILHPRYDIRTRDSDIAIVRTATDIIFTLNVGVARIAASTNNLNSHNIVQGIGWGATSFGGPHSETLQRVDLWVTDQIDCRLRYAEINLEVTQNMVCAGWLGVGGRDQCTGDNGSPLVLDGVVVGIRSWGVGCGNPRYPGVSTRMHRFSNWILENAINV